MQSIVPIDFSIVERLKEVFTLFKVIDFAIIEGGGVNIYGMNYEHSILKYTVIDPIAGLPPLVIIDSSSLAPAKYKEQKYFLVNSTVIVAESELSELDFVFYYQHIYSGYSEAKSLFKEIAISNITCHIEHIQKEASFAMQILSMRAADGVQYYKYNGYMMSLFVGILPIISSDDVQLDIIDRPDNPCFIGRFTIKKKNGLVLKVFLRFLKIGMNPVA